MRKRKGLAVISAIVMTAVLSAGSSLAATSVGISDGAADVTVNQTVVGFAGHDWWVIGDTKGGVYQQPNSVTLLAKNADFGRTEFRKRSTTEQEGYKEYGMYWYEGSFVDYPKEYKDSTLQRKMVSIADGLSEKERGKINNRTLSSSDDKDFPIAGEDVANQKLWPLSGDEYLSIRSDNVRSYGADNWLRSFFPDVDHYALGAPAAGDPTLLDPNGDLDLAARPALNLNLEAVSFTSSSGVAGKAFATPGGGLVSITAPDTTKNGKIKYTFEDSNLKLGNVYVSKIEGNKVTVAYEGATSGKTLSIIAKEKGGQVKYYGKLASSTANAGEGSFTVPDDFDFTKYSFEVIVEEINGENESDFASTPKSLNINTVTVNGGSGGGAYAKDSEVTVTANVPDGKYLSKWEISPTVQLTEGSLTDVTIKFTMPDEDVTATAVYGNIEYSVNVTGGTGGGNNFIMGQEVTLTANPPVTGKYFKGWSISPDVTLIEGALSSGIIKFNMPASDITATAEYEDLIVYPIKDGGSSTWQQGDEGGLIITSEGEHGKFTGVSVDGNMIGDEHYTAVSGSTVITLKASYLSTLSAGEHVLRIHFTDGYTETKFSIQEVPAPPTPDPGEPTPPVNPPVQPGEPNPPAQGGTTTNTTETIVTPVGTSPKTSDSSLIWIMASVMLGAGIGFMVVSVVKKRKLDNK